MEEILELLTETISIERDTVYIAGAEYPFQMVKGKLLKLNYEHIQYVLECLHKNTTKVRNIRAYPLACLFNALFTINNYYRAEVNHDMYGGNPTEVQIIENEIAEMEELGYEVRILSQR